VALLANLLCAAAAHGASVPALRGTGGAVVSDDPLATAVGIAVLRRGGNAVDAAVATALALAVTYPEAGNLGGGGFALVRRGAEVASLDFREVAPAAARRDMFLDEGGEPVPGASEVGPLAAGVPGSPAGLWELHRRFGSLPWPEVVEPARRLAADGFPVSPALARVLAQHRELLGRFPESARVWLPGGEPPAVGSTLRLPDLAATLDGYARRGPTAVTEGPVARAVEEVSRRHGGVLTAADLAAYRPVWRPPVRYEAFGWTFAALDLPSSGGIVLGETLGILERLGWAALPRFGAGRWHLLAEAWRAAYADRTLLADPETTAATAADLLAPAWMDARARAIRLDRAAESRAVAPWAPAAGPPEAADTTHVSVVDGAGDAVALTTTINDLFGSGLWVPGAGFFLNDEMDDFTTAPGRPNLYGLVQGQANAVAPGRRMLSSLTPTLAWRGGDGGDDLLVAGGRGGPRIPTNVGQVLLHVVVDGDELQAAIDRPRLHHQWLPDELRAEADALAPETRSALEALGHRFGEGPVVARVHVLRRRPDGTLEAARESRAPAAAAVVSPAP